MSAPIPTATDFAGLSRLRGSARQDASAALPEVARQFESLFTQMLLKSMRAVSFGDDLTGSQGGVYRDLFDQQMAVHLSSGRGLGLAEMMVRQMQGLDTLAKAGGEGITGIRSAADKAAMTPLASGSADASAYPKADPVLGVSQRSREDFISDLWPHAQEASQDMGVSPRFLIAQAALETGWGQYQPRHANGSASHNLFGIKAGPSWDGQRVHSLTDEFEDGKWVTRSESFRAYPSVAAGMRDFVQLIKGQPRYAEALSKAADPTEFAASLQKAGYATDPDYAHKIARILEGPTLQPALARIEPVCRGAI